MVGLYAMSTSVYLIETKLDEDELKKALKEYDDVRVRHLCFNTFDEYDVYKHLYDDLY